MKCLLIGVCLFLTGCVAVFPKKATSVDEQKVVEILSMHNCKLGPGTVEYFGETFEQAKYISGYAWKGLELGYFVIVIDEEGVTETFWSKDGSFPELEQRLQLTIPPPPQAI